MATSSHGAGLLGVIFGLCAAAHISGCSSRSVFPPTFPTVEIVQEAPPGQLDTRLFPRDPYAPLGAVPPPVKVAVTRYQGQVVLFPELEVLVGGVHPEKGSINLSLIQPFGGNQQAAQTCPVVVRWQCAPLQSLDADLFFSIADVEIKAVIRKGRLITRDSRVSFNPDSGELTMNATGFSMDGLRWVRENGRMLTDVPIDVYGTASARDLTGSVPALTLHSIDLGTATPPPSGR